MTKGHLDELRKAEIVSKNELVPSVFNKTHYWINHSYWILLERWPLQTGFPVSCFLIQRGRITHMSASFIGHYCFRHKTDTKPLFNKLRPRLTGRFFADDTFKRIFLNENIRISITISLKFVPNGPINNILALVLIMAWRRPGDKPLSEPMMVRSRTHICVTRPQWVKLVLVYCKSYRNRIRRYLNQYTQLFLRQN